ncbi:MAG: hypothetical protein EOP48_01710 [Sphingobacteriales bacterium]|nr:MAG: hypothetical protein EOP48_01710 [Sphingobacteriales bacterium]
MADGHFQVLEDVHRLPSELWLSFSFNEELMLQSEEFFMELIEEIEIQATCPDCGKMTVGILLNANCKHCSDPEVLLERI